MDQENAPDELVQRLRERAARNHRSLQGELMAIIEEAVRPQASSTCVNEVLAEVRSSDLPSPRRSSRDRSSGS